MNTTLHSPRLSGAVRAPSSKSEAHRALIVASLAALYGAPPVDRRVYCTDLNEDIEATVRCLVALGASINRVGEDLVVTPITAIPPSALLDCGESGSTLRFLLPVVAALGSRPEAPDGFTAALLGHGRLPERPLSPLYEELTAHGVTLSSAGSNPLVMTGSLQGGAFSINGGVSSQFISGLLFALPLLSKPSTLTVTGRIESTPYIYMTLDALTQVTGAISGRLPTFSISPATASHEHSTAVVGGDWSGAAFFLTAGVLAEPGCTVSLFGLDTATRQGDAVIVDVLRRMGGRIEINENGHYVAHGSSLTGCTIDATQIPDLVPILAVAAAVAEGETHITGAARLRLKESDRLRTVSNLLRALGGDVRETEDGLIIRGVSHLMGGTVDAAGDHRIAMSAAIAATRATGDVTVCGSEAVNKSYPAFWRDLSSILRSGGLD